MNAEELTGVEVEKAELARALGMLRELRGVTEKGLISRQEGVGGKPTAESKRAITRVMRPLDLILEVVGQLGKPVGEICGIAANAGNLIKVSLGHGMNGDTVMPVGWTHRVSDFDLTTASLRGGVDDDARLRATYMEPVFEFGTLDDFEPLRGGVPKYTDVVELLLERLRVLGGAVDSVSRACTNQPAIARRTEAMAMTREEAQRLGLLAELVRLPIYELVFSVVSIPRSGVALYHGGFRYSRSLLGLVAQADIFHPVWNERVTMGSSEPVYGGREADVAFRTMLTVFRVGRKLAVATVQG